MSVCPLCKNYTEYLYTVTVQPDLPKGARDTGEMCRQCKETISSVTSDTGECDWCGSGDHAFRVYNVSGEDAVMASKRIHKVGFLCGDCLSISEGEYPADFSEKKNRVRKRDGYECQRCGIPQEKHKEEFGQKLHVHHIDGDKRNNKLENLKTLCARCHGAV